MHPYKGERKTTTKNIRTDIQQGQFRNAYLRNSAIKSIWGVISFKLCISYTQYQNLNVCTKHKVDFVWSMCNVAHDVNTSGLVHVSAEQWGAPAFHSNWPAKYSCELLPCIDEYNELLFCAVVTFSSNTSWILGAKTSRKSVHCKVRFTFVFWPNSAKFFYLRSTYVVVSVLKFLSVDKNVHVRHRILNEYKLQLIVFGSILNSSDVFASVTLQPMDGCWRVFQAHGREAVYSAVYT